MSTHKENNFGGGAKRNTPKADNSRNELRLITPAQRELLDLLDTLDGYHFIESLRHVHATALYSGTNGSLLDSNEVAKYFHVHHITNIMEDVVQEVNTDNPLFNLLNSPS